MKTPFPGMDPYLEHPVLWTGVHAALIAEIRKQVAPTLRPRYVASIEERVVIDIFESQRIPDVWIQQVSDAPMWGGAAATALAEPTVLELEQLEVRQNYIEILDRYSEMRVVTVIEVVSPNNKLPGPGRDAYLKKQREVLSSDAHLVEIDLLRTGDRVAPLTLAQHAAAKRLDYLISVSRSSHRLRLETYPCFLKHVLPRFAIPLAAPDPDIGLDLQAALEQVYWDGSYMLRVDYSRPCDPALNDANQEWASSCWKDYVSANPDLFARPVTK